MNVFYLLGSLAGIGLLVGLNLFLMGRAKRRVDSDAAIALLAREQPGFRAHTAVSASDGAAALIEDEAGAFYLVAAAGADLVSRKLAPPGVKAPARDAATLRLPLPDPTFPRAPRRLHDAGLARRWPEWHRRAARHRGVVRLPSYEQVRDDPVLYAHASRVFHLETNPGNARALIQRHGDRELWLNPPPLPLTTKEMDAVFDLPYARRPHPDYGDARLPAYEMIRFSVNIMRGCFGGCTFCSITEHEGRIIQSRSEASIISEIEMIRDTVPGFTGTISDLGGPTANMYRMHCKEAKIEAACRRLSCVFPDICDNLNTDHKPLIHLYRRARQLPGVKRIFVASGLRYDLAVRSPEYIKELVTHHVGGYLKIAPEHTEAGPLGVMMKPGIATYEKFKTLFEQASKEAGKEQYLIPYFIAAHPGTTDTDMLELALWLKRNDFRLDQVQTFLPAPLALATAMYHTGHNPLKRVRRDSAPMSVPNGLRVRRLHKAFLRYHDPANWPLLREALQRMGRSDLIGNGKRHLTPAWQPAASGGKTTSPSQPRTHRARTVPAKPRRRRCDCTRKSTLRS